MGQKHSVCIAIDGEAAAGKSTIGRLLAERLGYLYFDTGVMYRAVAWAVLQRGIDVLDEGEVTSLAEALEIQVKQVVGRDGRHYSVYADQVDVTWASREPAVDGAVSIVAAYSGVRHALVEQQRRIAGAQDVVMIGRDIGTVVMPQAALKIYMRASTEERAGRRWAELRARGVGTSYGEVLASMQKRDHLDSHRVVDPLRVAPDAVVVDTDGLSIEQVLERVMALVDQRILSPESCETQTRVAD